MTVPEGYPCPECGKKWLTPTVAKDCCGEWLELDDYDDIFG